MPESLKEWSDTPDAREDSHRHGMRRTGRLRLEVARALSLLSVFTVKQADGLVLAGSRGSRTACKAHPGRNLSGGDACQWSGLEPISEPRDEDRGVDLFFQAIDQCCAIGRVKLFKGRGKIPTVEHGRAVLGVCQQPALIVEQPLPDASYGMARVSLQPAIVT